MAEEDPFRATRMTLGEHLEELRSRLFKGLAAVFVAFVVAWIYREPIAEIVLRPYDRATAMLERHFVAEAERILDENPGRPRADFFLTDDPADRRLKGFDRRPQGIAVGEGFFFTLKICLYFALFAGSPVLLWQMWQFVAAGLYERERRPVRSYFPVSVLLFLGGVLFGYFVMVPYAMYYLNAGVSLELVVPNVKLQSFLAFVSSLCLAFGAVFQLPLLMTFLASTDILPPSTMARYRGHFIVGAFVLAAILTPPDPFTQILMGGPMIVLYEVGILCGRLATRASRKSGLETAKPSP